MAKESRTYPQPVETVFREAQGALRDAKFKIESVDANASFIKAAAGVSLLSWGEGLKITVSKAHKGTSVCVAAEGRGPSYLTGGMGKAGKDIKKFFEALERRL